MFVDEKRAGPPLGAEQAAATRGAGGRARHPHGAWEVGERLAPRELAARHQRAKAGPCSEPAPHVVDGCTVWGFRPHPERKPASSYTTRTGAGSESAAM